MEETVVGRLTPSVMNAYYQAVWNALDVLAGRINELRDRLDELERQQEGDGDE
jgi:hypothetical protein